jgi:hypothetical protein
MYFRSWKIKETASQLFLEMKAKFIFPAVRTSFGNLIVVCGISKRIIFICNNEFFRTVKNYWLEFLTLYCVKYLRFVFYCVVLGRNLIIILYLTALVVQQKTSGIESWGNWEKHSTTLSLSYVSFMIPYILSGKLVNWAFVLLLIWTSVRFMAAVYYDWVRKFY